MKKYLIYTVNDTDPFVVETEEDLLSRFSYESDCGEKTMLIKHRKEIIGVGTKEFTVMLNLNNIVSITTSEKV